MFYEAPAVDRVAVVKEYYKPYAIQLLVLINTNKLEDCEDIIIRERKLNRLFWRIQLALNRGETKALKGLSYIFNVEFEHLGQYPSKWIHVEVNPLRGDSDDYLSTIRNLESELTSLIK